MSFVAEVYQTSSLIPGVPNPLGVIVRPIFDSGSLAMFGGAIPVSISGTSGGVTTVFITGTAAAIPVTISGTDVNVSASVFIFASASIVASGTVTVANFPAVQEITGSVFVLNNPTGSFSTVQPGNADQDGLGYVNGSAFVVLSASNRISFSIFNDSDQSCVIAFGSGSMTASLTNFALNLFAQCYYESPYPSYKGLVTGFWVSTATGSLRVTELFE